jgi:hypothetical protein
MDIETPDMAKVHITPASTCFCLFVESRKEDFPAGLDEIIDTDVCDHVLRKLTASALRAGNLPQLTKALTKFGIAHFSPQANVLPAGFVVACGDPHVSDDVLITQFPHLCSYLDLHKVVHLANDRAICWAQQMPAAAILRPALLQVMLQSGGTAGRLVAEPNDCCDTHGNSLLHVAVRGYHENPAAAEKAIELLLRCGADPRRPSAGSAPQFCLPIMEAARLGHKRAILMLAARSTKGIPTQMTPEMFADTMAMDMRGLTELLLKSVGVGPNGMRGAIKMLRCMRYKVERSADVLALAPLLRGPHRQVHLHVLMVSALSATCWATFGRECERWAPCHRGAAWADPLAKACRVGHC